MWPLLPSHGVPGSLMWLSSGYTVETEIESMTERYEERENEMRQKAKKKCTRDGGGLE